MKRLTASWRATALLVVAASGCGTTAPRPVRGDPQGTTAARPLCRTLGATTPTDRAACDKEWSVLVYMMADAPGLTPYALWNLHQMEGRLRDPAAPGSAA